MENPHFWIRSEVPDQIYAVHQRADQTGILEITFDEREIWIRTERLDVFQSAATEVVNHHHLIATRQQGFSEIGPDTARAACYQGLHQISNIPRKSEFSASRLGIDRLAYSRIPAGCLL